MSDEEKQPNNAYAKTSSCSSSTQLGHTHSTPATLQYQIVIGGHQGRFGCLMVGLLCVLKANLDYNEEMHW